MELIRRKKTVKKNSALIYVVYGCVGYLACASCKGMEEEKSNSDSAEKYVCFKGVMSDSDNSVDSNSSADSDNSVDSEEVGGDITGNSKSGLLNSSLYQCSKSEMFSLEQIVQKVNHSDKKVDRRIDAQQLDRFLELRKFDFPFEEALSQVKKMTNKDADISFKDVL